MKKNLINITELIKGILIIFSYFLIGNIISIPFSFLEKNKIISPSASKLLLYLVLCIIFVLIYNKDLIKDIKNFKKDYKNILKTSFKYWIKGLFIMIFSSYILTMLKVAPNTNQEANLALLESMPIVEFICAVIFAPITEELVFRRSLKNISSNKHIYALTSGIIFGFIHIISSLSNAKSLIMLLYLIPYSALGIAFAYAYKKNDNISGSMIFHSIHNALSLLVHLL